MFSTRKRESISSPSSEARNASEGDNCEFYLPRFVVPHVVSPVIESVGFSAEQNPKNGMVEYTFNVSWCDTSDAVSKQYRRPQKSDHATATASVNKQKVYSVKCDGPCGKVYTGVEMHQYGVCDHNICPDCFATAPSVVLFDGTPGCCNKDCYHRDLYIMNPTAEHRSLYGVASSVNVGSQTSRSETTTSGGAAELLLVRILLFKQLNGRINRQKLDREVSSKMRMKDFYGTLNNLITNLDESAIFFTDKTFFSRSDLVPLARKTFNKRRMDVLVDGKSSLVLVVIAPGVSLFKSPPESE